MDREAEKEISNLTGKVNTDETVDGRGKNRSRSDMKAKKFHIFFYNSVNLIMKNVGPLASIYGGGVKVGGRWHRGWSHMCLRVHV